MGFESKSESDGEVKGEEAEIRGREEGGNGTGCEGRNENICFQKKKMSNSGGCGMERLQDGNVAQSDNGVQEGENGRELKCEVNLRAGEKDILRSSGQRRIINVELTIKGMDEIKWAPNRRIEMQRQREWAKIGNEGLGGKAFVII